MLPVAQLKPAATARNAQEAASSCLAVLSANTLLIKGLGLGQRTGPRPQPPVTMAAPVTSALTGSPFG